MHQDVHALKILLLNAPTEMDSKSIIETISDCRKKSNFIVAYSSLLGYESQEINYPEATILKLENYISKLMILLPRNATRVIFHNPATLGFPPIQNVKFTAKLSYLFCVRNTSDPAILEITHIIDDKSFMKRRDVPTETVYFEKCNEHKFSPSCFFLLYFFLSSFLFINPHTSLQANLYLTLHCVL